MRKSKHGYMRFFRNSRYSFTLSYLSKKGDYFKFQYGGFGILEASRHFIKFIKEEGVNV